MTLHITIHFAFDLNSFTFSICHPATQIAELRSISRRREQQDEKTKLKNNRNNDMKELT